jgi:hypothetical protein
LPNPIMGLVAALGLPTRRNAFSEETAGSTMIACLRASHDAARCSPLAAGAVTNT